MYYSAFKLLYRLVLPVLHLTSNSTGHATVGRVHSVHKYGQLLLSPLIGRYVPVHCSEGNITKEAFRV